MYSVPDTTQRPSDPGPHLLPPHKDEEQEEANDEAWRLDNIDTSKYIFTPECAALIPWQQQGGEARLDPGERPNGQGMRGEGTADVATLDKPDHQSETSS